MWTTTFRTLIYSIIFFEWLMSHNQCTCAFFTNWQISCVSHLKLQWDFLVFLINTAFYTNSILHLRKLVSIHNFPCYFFRTIKKYSHNHRYAFSFISVAYSYSYSVRMLRENVNTSLHCLFVCTRTWTIPYLRKPLKGFCK